METHQIPEHGWTCFHCGETFTTPGAARDHFGSTPNAEPGCAIRVQLGGERGLLQALRKTEDQLARYMEEDTDLHRSILTIQRRHADALIAAEEAGYLRGMRDVVREPLDRFNSSDGAALLNTFAAALDVRPHLAIEIGFTRPTDWMVHIWDATGVGLRAAPKIICTQSHDVEDACRQAAILIREKLGI